MKTRVLIVIGLVIFSTLFVLVSSTQFIYVFDGGILPIAIYLKTDNEQDQQLQSIFDYCNDTSAEKNLVGLRYFNDTHYIDNNICKWQVLEKYPNSDRLCIPGQDSSEEKIRNDTHIYIINKCSWEEEFSWEKEWRTVSTTPFGYYSRDTTGNYDHCFSYKTDPEYGVKIQNLTHILNLENCEWELENEN